MQGPSREVRIAPSAELDTDAADALERAVCAVLDGEAAGPAEVSVTYLSAERMRELNRRSFDRDRPTDVIAFALPHPGRLVGDVYVCPEVARDTCRTAGVTEAEELVRLTVHGTLHVLGYDHPEGEERSVSLMWRLQERYVRQVMSAAR